MPNPEVEISRQEGIEANKTLQDYIWRNRDLDPKEASRITEGIKKVVSFRELVGFLRQARETGFVDELTEKDSRYKDALFYKGRKDVIVQELKRKELPENRKKALQTELQNISRLLFIDENPKTKEIKYYTYSAYFPHKPNIKPEDEVSASEIDSWRRERKLGSGIIKAINDKKTELSRRKREERETEVLANIHSKFIQLKNLMDETAGGDVIKLEEKLAQEIREELVKINRLTKEEAENKNKKIIVFIEEYEEPDKSPRGIVGRVKLGPDKKLLVDKDGNEEVDEIFSLEIIDD